VVHWSVNRGSLCRLGNSSMKDCWVAVWLNLVILNATIISCTAGSVLWTDEQPDSDIYL
jgi:hypothetical protein